MWNTVSSHKPLLQLVGSTDCSQVRRKIPSITSQSRNRLDVELDDLSRPAAAHVPTGRGTREPVTALRVVTASL
jgi:hypothetical protein